MKNFWTKHEVSIGLGLLILTIFVFSLYAKHFANKVEEFRQQELKKLKPQATNTIKS